MTQVIEVEDSSELTPEQETNLVKKMDKVGPYIDKFKTWCEKTKTPLTAASLLDWDTKHNNGKIRSYAGTKDEVYHAGLKIIFSRFLYNYFSWRNVKASNRTVKLTPLADPKSDKTSLSLVRRGVYVPDATEEQRQVMIDAALQAFKNAAIRLSTLSMPFAKLQLELSKLESHWVN